MMNCKWLISLSIQLILLVELSATQSPNETREHEKLLHNEAYNQINAKRDHVKVDSNENISQHISNSLSDSEQNGSRHSCVECGKEFISECDLNEHSRIKTNVACADCEDRFRSFCHMERHWRNENCRCTKCNREFENDCQLRKHHKIRNLPNCRDCNSEFENECDLEKHREIGIPQSCKECGAEFMKMCHFIKHSRPAQMVICNQCKRPFVTRCNQNFDSEAKITHNCARGSGEFRNEPDIMEPAKRNEHQKSEEE